jgi:DNA-binding MarR family transcriptional regulator
MIQRPLPHLPRGLERRTDPALVVETLRSVPFGGDALTLPQLRTLLALSARGAETAASLAEHLKLRESRIARVCALLVTRGLVIRVRGISRDADADADAAVVTLSTAGRRFVDDLTYDPRSHG